MVTFRRATADQASDGTAPFLTARRAVSALGALAALGLLTACGDGHATSSAPEKLPGAAQPATGDHTSADGSATSTAGTEPTTTASDSPDTAASASSDKGGAAGSRCHTSELRATVGRNNPGAGQENFPLVLTNNSGRTCTVDGYPGAAFVDASGKQLGPDPKRSTGSPTKITLAPGKSAWAGLTFSNPEISEADKATPAAILITPPDEKDSLKVKWSGGPVPVSGNSSTVSLTVFSAGTGA
ncbi:DUF4232 domain-containing protein [Streptomyces sp. NPDC003631]|uniref:DUF4232 domain-containing protein n=1 Tax=Streptomyces lannensis TaxID=766498 RepID=A0ABP7K086_9ACTN